MTDFRVLCAELLFCLDDFYPLADGEGWPVSKAWAAMERTRAALAEPDGPAVQSREPASVTTEPSDEELLEMTEDWPATTGPRHDLSGCPEVPLYSVFEDEVIEFARDVLARWGTAAPQPIPVSERLPEAGDCDAEGRCWWWYAPVPEKTYGYWAHEDHAIPERALEEWPTHWLPAHALPLPSGEVK